MSDLLELTAAFVFGVVAIVAVIAAPIVAIGLGIGLASWTVCLIAPFC